MRPGKAPASPTSRPVVMGRHLEAEADQMKVSGIGEAPEHMADGARHKDGLRPTHYIDPAESTPKIRGAHVFQEPDPTQGVGALAAAAEGAPAVSVGPSAAPEQAKEVPEPTAEPSNKHDDDDFDPIVPAGTAPEKLNEAAMDPDPPAPAPEPQAPVPHPAADPLADTPVHDAAPPSLDGQVVVSHHTTMPSGTGKLVALVALMLVFALIVLDILLDVGLISTSVIPHTNLF
jgi:hypothetical protein